MLCVKQRVIRSLGLVGISESAGVWGVIGSGFCAGWGLLFCVCTVDVKEATVREEGEGLGIIFWYV